MALLSLFLMSFCALPSLLITLPRYVKMSTHSSVRPTTVRGASRLCDVLIHITFIFGSFMFSPTWLAANHTLSVLSRIWAWLHAKTARSSGHPDISRDRKKFSTVCLHAESKTVFHAFQIQFQEHYFRVNDKQKSFKGNYS